MVIAELPTVQYRTTGVTLDVTPTVHVQGTVTLLITSDCQRGANQSTSTIYSPMILNREITTEAVATDNQTIILAGLIKDNARTTETRIPLDWQHSLILEIFQNYQYGP